jgi:hypothetical protein
MEEPAEGPDPATYSNVRRSASNGPRSRFEGTQQPGVDLDHVFDVLRNQRRRDVLRYLDQTREPIQIGDLAEQLAAWENDKSVGELSSSERKRMYVGLYQSHLPKMDDLDVVDFDKPRGVVAPGEEMDAYARYLQPPEALGDRTIEQYAIPLSVLGAILLGAALVLSTMTAFDGLRLVAGIVAVVYLLVGLASVLQ